MMKPKQILGVLLSCWVFLIGLMAFADKEEGIVIGPYSLSYPSLADFFNPEQVEYAEIDTLLAVVDTAMFTEAPVDTVAVDSSELLGAASITEDELLDPARIIQLEFPEDKPYILDAFFKKLDETQRKKSRVRVVHYGDSQLEGDRITAYVRQRLQERFGGYGAGLIAMEPLYSQLTIRQRESENWKRHAFYLGRKPLPHSKYGPMSCVYRFTWPRRDSVILADSLTYTGWVELKPSKRTYANARRFNYIRVLYGNARYPVEVTVTYNGEVFAKDSLIADGRYHSYNLRLPNTPKEVKLSFKTKDSPDFYGISLEGDYGLNMDNIAMRGSAGKVFTQHDGSLLGASLRDLGADLIILQFGGNGVPYLKEAERAYNFGLNYKNQIRRMQRLCPDAQVVLIGPSDMSTRIDGQFKTYPNLTDVIRGMKAAAAETGAVYWDIYKAMGGHNSMPTWVSKGLAASDYVHFSTKGSKYISQLLYQAILYEYQQYKKRN